MARYDKDEVDYSPGHPRGDHCGVCSHYLGSRLCELVRGDIDPAYWCDRFRRRRMTRHVHVHLHDAPPDPSGELRYENRRHSDPRGNFMMTGVERDGYGPGQNPASHRGHSIAVSIKKPEGGRALHVVHGVTGSNPHAAAVEYLTNKGHRATSSWYAVHTASASPHNLRALQSGRYTEHHYDR